MSEQFEFDPTRSAANSSKVLRNAASLLVVRDAAAGMEVLMLQRPERAGDLYSGACVFPGGVIEDSDRTLYEMCEGRDDKSASASLGISEHGLGYFVAAIRECFEEAGLLFAYGIKGKLFDLDGVDDIELASLRRRLRSGEAKLGETCRNMQLRLAVDQLVYYSHWLTPPGLPKRFDTRFFLAIAPAAQTAVHDGHEAVQHFWLRPAEAVARAREFKLRPATLCTLKSLAPFASVAACYQHALKLCDIELMMPRRARSAGGPRILLPDEAAYAEVARIDPDGHGDASCEIEYDRAVRLSKRVIRLTAPNGNVMTGPGTNTYLVGGGHSNEWAVIDPGPEMAAHVDRILAAATGPIRSIFVTHTHRDHSPAAALLKSLTGAKLFGQPTPSQEWPNSAFQPDHVLIQGERIAIGDSATLRVVHTPGHASNHLCYLLEEEKTLFTGDHVMQGSSVVITPPDGDMQAYLGSLQALLQEDLDWLAPGHGHLMDDPHKVIRKAIDHRLMRETKILRAISAMAPVDIDSLLSSVYDDVPGRMHPMAKRSLLAHLTKLLREGTALEREGFWHPRSRAA
ncbi:MAG: MBL fold metallo-hydrolase [Proteobacteria bacterium]|nr:MBL fold metallo-hydrolase [Pseudomonadota bacterium]